MRMLTVKMGDDEMASLKALAESRGESMAATVRAGLGCLVSEPRKAARVGPGSIPMDRLRPPVNPGPIIPAVCVHVWVNKGWGMVCSKCQEVKQ